MPQKNCGKTNLAVNLVSVTLVTAGTIAGAVTLNPIILGTITGAGLLLKTTSEIKQYSNKIAMFKIGLSTYEKTLVDLRTFLRGKEYSRDDSYETLAIRRRTFDI